MLTSLLDGSAKTNPAHRVHPLSCLAATRTALSSSAIWLVAVSLLVGLMFLQEPGFGDDFTYWSLAFDLHEIGSGAWSVHSFHHLRWPIWGPCWVLQAMLGPGLASYYLVPLGYLAGGALLARAFGERALQSRTAGWVAASAFLFQPLLNAVIFRPMPDLPEGIFGAVALWTWWRMMESRSVRDGVPFGILSGLSIGLAFSTRVTGIFIAPVLLAATLALYPAKWRWLLLPAGVALAYFLAEGAMYHSICGDWWHGVTANLSNRGVKGTEPISLWKLPVRYLGGLLHGDRLAPLYAGLELWGLWSGWRSREPGRRLVAIWFVVSYLEYSCAVQSLHPVRPLIGGAVRYLATLAIPAALLAAMGALDLVKRLVTPSRPWALRAASLWPRCGVAVGVGGWVILALLSSRPWTDLGYLHAVQKRLAEVPAGTRIFTHRAMRDLAFLASPQKAQNLVWSTPKSILTGSPESEAAAASSEQYWYIRKLLWLNERKSAERVMATEPQVLASYVQTPEREWRLAEVLQKNNGEPEIVFYERRLAGQAAPQIVESGSAEWPEFRPAFPMTWSAQAKPKPVSFSWSIPAARQGRLVRFEARGSSTNPEPVVVKLRFRHEKQLREEVIFKPIFVAGGGMDFLPLHLPSGAEVCDVSFQLNPHVQDFTLTGFRAVFEAAQ